MGKVKSFTVRLTENKSVFYPGETVKGYCELHIKDFVKISLISIELVGVGKVFWTETRSSGTRLGPITENFRSEVEYVRVSQEIPFHSDRSDSENSGEKRHVFSFQFGLPQNLVTSFEGKFGYVRYFIKADLVRPWPRSISVKKYLTVIKPIDTNSLEYQRSIAASDESELCCSCFCQSGTIHVTAQTDRVAYCPGESIAITARFHNNSVRTVKPYALLCQTQKFHAKGLTQTVTYRLAMLTGLPLESRQSADWDSQLVRLPPVSPSILNSMLIEVHYCVKVGLVIPYCRDVRVTMPIVVGTVPFRTTRLTANTLPTSSEPPSYYTLSSSIPHVSSYPDTSGSSEFSFSEPPPAYVESILAAGYLTDDDLEQYNVNDYDSDDDDDDSETQAITRNEVSSQSDTVASVLLPVNSRSRRDAVSYLNSSDSRQDSSSSWWRRLAEPGYVIRGGISQTSTADEPSVRWNRRRPAPGNSSSGLRTREFNAGSSQSASSGGNRRFAPLCPYVAYAPPPTYNEVMFNVVETSSP